jgi:hypothetical protein
MVADVYVIGSGGKEKSNGTFAKKKKNKEKYLNPEKINQITVFQEKKLIRH